MSRMAWIVSFWRLSFQVFWALGLQEWLMRDDSKKIPPIDASDPRGSALVRTLPSTGPSSSSKELCKEKNACRCSSGRTATFSEMESRTRFLEFPPLGTLNNGDSERMRVPLAIVVAATRPWPLPGIAWIVYKRSQIALCIGKPVVTSVMYKDSVLMSLKSNALVFRDLSRSCAPFSQIKFIE